MQSNNENKGKGFTKNSIQKKLEKCFETLKPKLVLKRLTFDQIFKYDKHFITTEDKSDSIENCNQFMRNINMISNTELKTNSIEVLKQTFPIRSIDRSHKLFYNYLDSNKHYLKTTEKRIKPKLTTITKRKRKPFLLRNYRKKKLNNNRVNEENE